MQSMQATEDLQALDVCRRVISEWVQRRKGQSNHFSLNVDVCVALQLLYEPKKRAGDMFGSLEITDDEWFHVDDPDLYSHKPGILNWTFCSLGYRQAMTINEWLKERPYKAAKFLKARAEQWLAWDDLCIEWSRLQLPPDPWRRPEWCYGKPPPIRRRKCEELLMICKQYIDYCESAVAQMPDKQRLIVEICNNYSRKNYHIAAQLILMMELVPKLYFGSRREGDEMFIELVLLRRTTRQRSQSRNA
jgi:hypothetical protein